MSDTAGAGPPEIDARARMALTFGVLTEVNIVAQLSAAAFERQMPGWLTAHFGVVQHLIRRGDGVTPMDLARAFQQPKTTMTHTLQVLERRGLIAMSPNPRDGRSKLIVLTEAGRAWHAKATAQVAQGMAAMHSHLAPGTLEALLPHLEHLRAVMDNLREG